MLKGSKCSEETLRKMRQAHSKYRGVPLSEERKENISKATRGKSKPTLYGNKNSLGNRVSEEHKEKLRAFHKGKKWNLGGKHSEATKKHLSNRMKGRTISIETREKLRRATLAFLDRCSKGKETSIEKKFRIELENMGIAFVPQKNLEGIARVDFYLPDYKAVIQCDGKHWHSKPGRIKRDTSQDMRLQSKGYLIFRFSDSEINSNVSDCVDSVLSSVFGNIER